MHPVLPCSGGQLFRLSNADEDRICVFVHVIAPDPKFPSRIRNLFEIAAPGQNRYVLLPASGTDAAVPEWAECAQDGLAASRLIGQLDKVDGLLTHGLSFASIGEVSRCIAQKTPIAWYVWGWEAYTHWRPLREGLHQTETRKLIRRVVPMRDRIMGGVKSRLRPLLPRYRRGLERITYCVTPLPDEYRLFIECGMPSSVKYHWGHEGLLEDTVDLSEPLVGGMNIQVGNSASWTNNHVDAFRKLAAMDLGEARVIVPLSYGDSVSREAVLEAGRRILGERFSPMTEFMPLRDYSRLLGSCGHVVMNHDRQEALGNVLGALWRGSRVYLNNTVVRTSLTSRGLEIDLMDDMLPGTSGVLPPLTECVGVRNRDVLHEEFSRERVLTETRDLLERMRGGR